MEFRTTVSVDPFEQKISYNSKILFLGSCFATNMGNRMGNLLFPSLINPFGVLYNPFSISQSLNILMANNLFSEEQLFNQGGLWGSFYHHSSFSSPSKEECLTNINQSLATGREFLKDIDFLVITLGTSWTYQYRKTRTVVANCHKFPAKDFDRIPMTEDEIMQMLAVAIIKLREKNPKLKVIFTISPIRHWKDGAMNNMVSKATLIMAAQKMCLSLHDCYYFPAFEIMMDDLRDYRFYAEDMIHPSSVAVDYIFEKFVGAAIDPETAKLIPEVERLIKAANHRPFNPDTPEHLQFKKTQLHKTIDLQKRFPLLNLSVLLEQFQ